MTRVLIAGFLHETNTFAPTPARWENFRNGEGFPGMHLGNDVLNLTSVNIPLGGFVLAADPAWEMLPVVWCAASPSGPVESSTFERITGMIEDACAQETPDAVYLDLHGAMVSEDYPDGDGEILRRVRSVVGADTPIVVSLDLHANVSDLMLETANAMVAYRTYPHVDMAETGRSAAALLRRMLAGEDMTMRAERINFLIPTISGSTLEGPARFVYELLDSPDHGAVLSIAMAFPAADVEECQPCVFGYGVDEGQLSQAVDGIAAAIHNLEPEFRLKALPADQALDEAVRAIADGQTPVVIADTQDNPGAGGDATTTGLLRQLVQRNIASSALAAMWSPEIVQAAIAAGRGETVTASFAGSEVDGDSPFGEIFHVEEITDGKIHFDGPMMNGNELSVGPSVLLRRGNVRIVVNSHKAQIMDRNQFRAAGVSPEKQQLLVVKSSVHFRADFAGMGGKIIVALAPGPFPADPAILPWRNLRPGLRLGPLGPAFTPMESSGQIDGPERVNERRRSSA
ncbi:M81 family metallopeptidase [Arthrobacter sp. Edens01]|uniref:M81 family metallopeptidase n=1 Tax=Arthrobacter sp. Edens01 TaxID=1732020 RepID=UPI0006DADA69|nr:M81 family metallopeptidase [Arthrobacter sp. Edens01]KPN21608.1 microcystin degradation protein MlrC [Arthrobacter sp. Edens01]